MNNPNPLLPQGSLHSPSKGKSNFRIAVFTILAIHVVLICGFLIQGCKREPVQPEVVEVEPTNQVPDSFDSFSGSDTASNPFPTTDDTNAFPPYNETQPTDPVVSTGAPAVTDVAPVPAPSVPTNLTPSIPTTEPSPIPQTTPSAETTTHVVVSGDMLGTIAQKYKVTVRDIEEANPGVNPNRLQIGQKLNIPAPSATAPSTSPAPTSSGDGDYTIYTVKSGDVLERIARNNNTTVSAIKSANNLRTDRINVGQKLKIPKKSNGQ